MAKGNEILAYKGDAASGIASNRGAVSVFGDTDSAALSQTVRDIAINSFHKNRILFDQKIKDRDAAFQMLDDEALVLTDILEEHRPLVEEQINKVQDIFYEANGDIMSDPKKYREFAAAIREAKNHVKQAQKHYTGITAEMAERSKITNPIDQAKYDKHISDQLGKSKENFWTTYTPFAPVSDFDVAVVAAPWQTTERTYENGFKDVKEVMPDVRATLNDYRTKYLQDDKNHMFKKYVDTMISAPNADELVDRVQKGIDRLNAETGAKKGDANYVEPLNVVKPKGSNQWVLQDDFGTAAAKIKLSEAKKVTTETFNSERSARDINLRKINVDYAQLGETIRHNKATENLDREDNKLEQDKWASSQKGGDTQINGAMTRAKRIYGEMQKLTDQYGVISPDKVRQLNNEQRKYLGLEAPILDADGKPSSKVLNPLDLGTDKEFAIQLVNGQVKIMKPKGDGSKLERTAGGGFSGHWDNTKSTNLYNMATNILNEELQVAGAKELNSYWGVDVSGTNTSSTSGGTTTQSGGTKQQAGTVQSYNRNDLKKANWTDAQIDAAVKAGRINVQ